MLEQIRQISVSIAELDALADQQIALANDLDAHGAAEAIRRAAQYHRRQADELRSELASIKLGCSNERPAKPLLRFSKVAL